MVECARRVLGCVAGLAVQENQYASDSHRLCVGFFISLESTVLKVCREPENHVKLALK